MNDARRVTIHLIYLILSAIPKYSLCFHFTMAAKAPKYNVYSHHRKSKELLARTVTDLREVD